MKMNYKLVFRLLILSVLFASCTASYKTIVVETAKPSPDILPENINSLTLMNRGITGEFRNFDRDTLQQYFYSKNFNVNAVVLDSMAADTTLKVLGELLYESGRYDVVIPKDRNFARDLKFYKIPEELDWNEVKLICNEFSTDALLVIERYYNKLSTNYVVHPASMEYGKYVSGSIDSKYDAVVKIYDPSAEKIVRQVITADTISWYDTDVSTRGLFAKLPPVKECLIQTGIRVALDLDSKLSPEWVRENRIFFVIEKNDITKIGSFITNDDWQSAYDYWLPYTRSSKKTIKSKAEFNLALASEMLGNLDEAIEWANKSYYTQYHTQTENYLYKLKKRKEILQNFQTLETK